jgi:hypothetical protein
MYCTRYLNKKVMEIFIRKLKILKKYFLNLKIRVPGKNFQAPWQPGALYLSTPDYSAHVFTLGT